MPKKKKDQKSTGTLKMQNPESYIKGNLCINITGVKTEEVMILEKQDNKEEVNRICRKGMNGMKVV